MTQRNQSTILFVAMAFVGVAWGVSSANAEPPRVRQANVDYEASGFVMPAGGISPAQAGVMPVGFLGGGSGCDCCDSGGCDSATGGIFPGMFQGGCLGGGACGGLCGGGCGGVYSGGCGDGTLTGGGGVLGKYYGAGACGGCGMAGCGSCDGLSSARFFCIFCRGQGCEACQMISARSLCAAFSVLKPYTEAGRCAQRWYDVSAEALFLDRSTTGIGTDVITQRQSGGVTEDVILADDVLADGLEEGVRLSAAFIFGAGGNIEATYLGGQEWENSATATSPATFGPGFPPPVTSGAELYSFLTDFGNSPPGGFDDTDRSVIQTASNTASFHSGELNYRRRTVGPYCRFQGSWLFGMRYFRYDSRLGLDIRGLTDDGVAAGPTDDTLRFFRGSDSVDNALFGAQIGGDLWYNVMPGINFGMEIKGAWLKNEIDGTTIYAANSLNAGAPGAVLLERGESDGTLALEFQAALAYRLSHSWTFRSAYYLIAIDDVATTTFNRDYIMGATAASVPAVPIPEFEFDSVVFNGFSFGTEYTW